MSVFQKQTFDLIESIYAASLDRRQWPSAIANIARAVGGQGGVLNCTNYATQETQFWGVVGYEEKYLSAYSKYFISIDPYRNFFENNPLGTLQLAPRFKDFKPITAGEFHLDFMLPQDKVYVVGATLARDDDVTVKFTIHRSRKAGDFGQKDLRLLSSVLPHLSQSARVQLMLTTSATHTSMALASLDQVRAGVFLINSLGKVLHINREAEKLLTSGELVIHQQRLSCAGSDATARLNQLIASAARPALNGKIQDGSMLTLKAASGNGDLELRVAPLVWQERLAEFPLSLRSTAVFASRVGALLLPWQKVAALYHLSPAEAKLAVILAEGRSPEQAAERLQVSINTVRSQLKSVFAKTSTSRQSELVANLLRGALASPEMISKE